ncbi:MAG: DUF3857 domain-containing transglutaminase family protein [Robiginitomaculum sp.]|nr:DUF3857 domain-containing transglutaminase family protein [Robiginitomaculum sp.]
MRKLLAVVFVLLFSSSAYANPKAPEILYAPAPNWIVPVTPATYTEKMAEESGGSIYLLVDTQTTSDKTTEKLYFRRVTKTINISGVEDASDVSITIDPAFQKLTIHHLRVIRGGRVFDQTERAEIDLARFERDLDKRIYNGQWTALVRLSDVRSGDIVDIAWTREGRNPVFGKNDFGTFSLAWSVPVEKRHLRVDWPTEMIKRWQMNDAPVDPKIETIAANTVFTFGPYSAPAVQAETGTPNWVNQYPVFEISSFKDWSEVSRWAAPYYQSTLPPEVAKIVDDIRLLHKTPEAQLLAALRFAQEEVRYLSISIGEGGYIPRSPEITLQKRFGDCKDKTMLFVSLARALGFDVIPALASLNDGPGLTSRLPSPGAFDHVIAEVKLNGKTYWFDATAKDQRGSLKDFDQARYGYALPISLQTPSLAHIADEDNDLVTLNINETLDISGGSQKPLKLTSITEYRGRMADFMRNRLSSQGRKEIEKSYITFYETYFPGIRYLKPMKFEDNESENYIKVTEELIADNPYLFDEDVDRFVFNYTVHGVAELVNSKASRSRKTLLAVVPRVNTRHKISVILDNKGRDWELENESRSFDNAAFKFDWSAKKTRGKWVLEAKLQSKTNTVDPSVADKVLNEHKKVRYDIGWGLRFGDKD